MKKTMIKNFTSMILCALLVFSEITPVFKDFAGNIAVVFAMEDAEALQADLNVLNSAISSAMESIVADGGILSAPLADSDGVKYLLDSLNLPKFGENGSTIEWASSSEEIIASDGTVIRPLHADAEVTLTAILDKGGIKETANPLTFTVASLETQIAGTPILDRLISYNDFSGDTFEDNHMKSINGGVGVGVGGNKLTIAESTSSNTGVDLFICSDGSTATEGFYAEFVMTKKDRGTGITLRFIDSNIANNCLDIAWGWSGIPISDRESVAAGSTFFSIPLENGELPDRYKKIYKKCRLGIYVDPINETYEVWIDHEKLFDEPRHLKNISINLRKIQMYINKASQSNGRYVNLDSYRLYHVPKPDDDCVTDDLVSLTKDSLLSAPLAEDNETKYLVDSLHLPNKGGNGSAIYWESSAPEIISEDGTVIRPYDDNETVTLRAKVTKGSVAEYSEEFEFNVPSLKAQIAGTPKLADLTAYNEFEGDTLDDAQILSMGGLSIKNSFMTVTQSASGVSGADFYINRDKAVADDAFYTEFVMTKKDRGTNAIIRIGSGQADYRLGITWGWSGIAIADYESDVAGSTYFPIPGYNNNTTFDTPYEKLTKACRLGIYVDPVNDTYQLWIDNKKLFDEPRHLRNNNSKLRKITFYMDPGNDKRYINIDSYRIYSIWREISDDARVRADFDTITDTFILAENDIGNGIVETNLNLPKRGKNGSAITWVSSEPDIIAPDGAVIRKSGDGYDRVTLKAVVSYGTPTPVIMEKEFVFKVLRNNTELTLTPTVANIRWEDHFDNPESNNKNIKYDVTDTLTKREQKDSKYIVERGADAIAAGKSAYTDFWASEGGYGQDYHKGILGLEFTLGRDNAVPVFAHLRSKDSKNYVTITWGSTGNVVVCCRESDIDESYKNITLERIATSNEVKITLLMDTEHGKFDLWVDDKLYLINKYTRETGVTDFQFMKLYYDGGTAGTWWIEHWKLYNAVPPDDRKLDYDINTITADKIVTKPLGFGNYVDSNFNLYPELPYGSDISWSCDRPDIVDCETGIVTTHADMTEDTPIKLTAHVTNGVFEKDVVYDFIIVRNGESEDVRIDADMEFFTDDLITTQPFNEIREALNLISKGPLFGTEIIWESSNPDVIATSGRVIRQRWDGEPKQVTLTATIGGKYTKEFNFTVLPDDYIGDTDATSDGEFFGVWNGSEWTTPGKLSYDSFPKLGGVEAAVKANDYTKAKEELLSYMRQRFAGNSNVAGRNKRYADYIMNGGSETGHTNFYIATGAVKSAEYEQIEIDMADKHGITAGYEKAFTLMSKYRDSVEVTVAGASYPVNSMRPVLMVEVNYSPRYYTATDASVVRAGDYRTVSYGNAEELKVKMFGELLSDETYRTLLKFDLSDLTSEDVIGNATLILYAKKSNAYSEPKEFYVMKQPDVLWNGETVNWMTFKGLYYNFNGLDGLNNWSPVAGSDIEYRYQTIRFQKFLSVASEYLYTNDEKYAYSVIYNMMDFITSKKCTYQRTLDSNIRLRYWMYLYTSVLESKYMTPDINTAMLKRFYNSLTEHADDTTSTANATVTKFQSVIEVSSYLKEYTDSARCRQKAIDFFDKEISNYFFDDGTYREDTGGYLWVSLTEYVKVKDLMASNGIESSERFDSIVHNAAYYDMMLRGPGGELLAYGDEATKGTNGYGRYTNFVNYYNDRELQFLDTQGAKGEVPSWTSRLFPESSYVFLRSDWSKDAQYLFTNVRNGEMRNHGNADDNGIILFGYGRNLLTDAGYVSYSTGPERSAATSTLMHNTVEINGKNQKNVAVNGDIDKGIGTTDDFTANENFDFVSQTSRGYEYIGNKHKRTITFVKPDFYIVSDLMSPTDGEELYTYKQLWHMTPNSGLYTEDNKIYSDFADGGNIIIANADNSVPEKAIGVYTVDYGGNGDAPYAYYSKETKGDASFDTVLLPYKSESSELNVERIDMGVPTSEATALKINMNKDGNETTVYYMLEYTDGTERIFDKYKTDAQMAVVVENKNGRATELIIHDGTYIKSVDGSLYVDMSNSVRDVAVELNGTDLNIVTTVSNLNISSAQIKLGTNVEKVRLNGQLKEFVLVGSEIKPSGNDKEEEIINDNNDSVGIVTQPTPGGAGGGTGGTPVIPVDKSHFIDINGHWASDSIESAYSAGIISGYPDGSFRPNNDITRAEFLTVVCRAIGLEGKVYSGGFADVGENDWYSRTLAVAIDSGIISKADNFRPNDSITREEMCKILAIALRLSKNMGTVPKDYDFDYADGATVSEWANEYVRFVSYFKIMNGMDDGCFAPQKNATRGEAATVLQRSLQ